VGNLFPIFRKEWRRYFASPIGYVLLAGAFLMFGLGVVAPNPFALIGPVTFLTHFMPGEALPGRPHLLLLVGTARLIAMCLIPLITMRLFVEEKRDRTIEMLFTSPVKDRELILAKWLGALVLYVLLLGVSLAELAAAREWTASDSAVLAAAYAALFLQGAAIIAAGESISTFTRHESAAVAATALVSVAVFRFSNTGILTRADLALCLLLTAAGWLLTWRSIRTLRNVY
jgi:ABC-2 type transport system permease protein